MADSAQTQNLEIQLTALTRIVALQHKALRQIGAMIAKSGTPKQFQQLVDILNQVEED